jgi:hypothetical protein
LTEPGQGFVQDAPISVRDTIASLIAEHHVEPPFVKRKRNRADPDAWHRAARNTGATMSSDLDFLARRSRRKRVAATDKIRQSQQIETSDGVAAETTSASLAPDEYTAIRSCGFVYNRTHWCRIKRPRFPRNRGT